MMFGRITKAHGLAALLVLVSHPLLTAATFDPRQYVRKSVQCHGELRREYTTEDVKIELSYIDVNKNKKPTLLLVHGWPSAWSTWSKQIEALEGDYHLVVPDLRGFGYSSHPDDFKASHTMGDIVQDLACVLNDAQTSSAVCIGHDWGAQVCYEAARMRPDIFTAVIGLVVPYIPSAGPYLPFKKLVPAFPKLAYQLYFDGSTEKAAEELNQDIRRSLRATMRTVASPPPAEFLTSQSSFLESWKSFEEIPHIPFFTKEEEDYLVELFSRQGFLYTLGFYTNENRHKSWSSANSQGNHTISQPVLAIFPTQDPVADWESAMKILHTTDFIPHFTTKYFDGAHWLHLENPELVNNAIKEWLGTLPSHNIHHRVIDEL